MIGQMIDGRYIIQSHLSRGGMGMVYVAFDNQQKQPVALKLLHPFLDSPDMVARFVLEFEVLIGLDHKNIVQVLDTGRYAGLPYLVMELLPGQTLRQVLIDGPLPHRPSVAIAQQVVEALIYIHQRGLVHRDLKPSNIMLCYDGDELQVKLLDFGLVQTADSVHDLQQSTSTLGTIAYVAPEQAQGYSVDFRADLYALGAILYEMATGQPPFVNENLALVLMQQITERPLHPHQLNPLVDESWANFILHLLEKEPWRRPLSTQWVAVQLTQLASPMLSTTTYEAGFSSSSRRGTPAWID